MQRVVASYSEANFNNAIGSYDSGAVVSDAAQNFLGNGDLLDSCKFYLKKSGSPTGNATAKLFAMTGDFAAETGKPTGSALATSTTVLDISTLTTSYQLITFEFDNTYTLANGTYYCIVIDWPNGDVSNYVLAGDNASNVSGKGNESKNEGGWSARNTRVMIFYVYGEFTPLAPRLTLLGVG